MSKSCQVHVPNLLAGEIQLRNTQVACAIQCAILALGNEEPTVGIIEGKALLYRVVV